MNRRDTARMVRVADAPPLAGLRFRAYAGPADLGAMAEVQNAALAADGVDEAVTPDVIANDLLGDPRIDPDRDLVIVELDRVVGGWSGRWRWVEDGTGDAILSHRGYLAPAARARHRSRAASPQRVLPARRAGASRRVWPASLPLVRRRGHDRYHDVAPR